MRNGDRGRRDGEEEKGPRGWGERSPEGRENPDEDGGKKMQGGLGKKLHNRKWVKKIKTTYTKKS